MSYYTQILKCPKKCSESAQARYFPAQDGLPAVIVCSHCGAQWTSNSNNLQQLIKENHLFDVPDEIVQAQKR